MGGKEKKAADVTDPKSEFSDSDENDDGLDGVGKTFRRRLSDALGTCFVVRKD